MTYQDRFLPGFPLADHAVEPASKADLFFIASVLFRICSVQNKALRSIEAGDRHGLGDELANADRMLSEIHAMLQSD